MKKSALKCLQALLAAALLAGLLVSPAAAAQSASGATLRLEKAEGTVTVENASGKAQTVKDGMRLYSGYTVKTAPQSYAYVSLDGDKAVKLDVSSSVKLKKSGKLLELTLDSGKLYFDVKAPLKSGESMNIRTSTMITGVRGTIGWVEIKSREESHLHLLEGKMTLKSTNVKTGAQTQITIEGGQSAGAFRNPENKVSLHRLDEKLGFEICETPGFAAIEVKKDINAQMRIRDNSPLVNVDELIAMADIWLQRDKDEELKKLEILKPILESGKKSVTKQVFEEVDETVYYHLSLPSSGLFVTVTPLTPTVVEPGGSVKFSVENTVTTYSPSGDTIDNITVAGSCQAYVNGDALIPVMHADTYDEYLIENINENLSVKIGGLEASFSNNDRAEYIPMLLAQTGVSTVTANVSPAESDGLSFTSALTVGSGKTLNLYCQSYIDASVRLTVNGTLVNYDTMNNSGELAVNGTLQIDAAGEVYNLSSVTVSGRVENDGWFESAVTDVEFSGSGSFYNDGKFIYSNTFETDANDLPVSPHYETGPNGDYIMWGA